MLADSHSGSSTSFSELVSDSDSAAAAVPELLPLSASSEEEPETENSPLGSREDSEEDCSQRIGLPKSGSIFFNLARFLCFRTADFESVDFIDFFPAEVLAVARRRFDFVFSSSSFSTFFRRALLELVVIPVVDSLLVLFSVSLLVFSGREEGKPPVCINNCDKGSREIIVVGPLAKED